MKFTFTLEIKIKNSRKIGEICYIFTSFSNVCKELPEQVELAGLGGGGMEAES